MLYVKKALFLGLLAAAMVITGAVAVALLHHEPTAQAEEQRASERACKPAIEELDLDARILAIRAEEQHTLAASIRDAAELPATEPVKRRSIKQFPFESPAETRAKLWNVPLEENNDATATAFLRVCISEADGSEADCLGIWQVLGTIRSRSCDRERVPQITMCDENGETLLSVMRRASKSILGIAPPRSRRSQWISELDLECAQPASWQRTPGEWERQYQSKRCPRVAKMARDLVSGDRDFDWPITNAHPIAWGGRCESGRGACDDHHACKRGLARLTTDTMNAFWCRPGTAGCPQDIDPVCIQLGYPSLRGSTEEDGG